MKKIIWWNIPSSGVESKLPNKGFNSFSTINFEFKVYCPLFWVVNKFKIGDFSKNSGGLLSPHGFLIFKT